MTFETRTSLRRDLETFLLWYAGVYIFGAVITGIGIPYAMKQMMLRHGSDMATSIVYLSALGPHLTGVVAAAWLWRREHPSNRSRVIWALFGLAASLWSIGLYLLIVALTPSELPQSVEVNDPVKKS